MIGVLTAIATGFLGWFTGRRKAKAETLAKEIFNVDKAVEIWRELALDLKKELKDVSEKCDRLTLEITELRKENKQLKHQLSTLTAEIKKH